MDQIVVLFCIKMRIIFFVCFCHQIGRCAPSFIYFLLPRGALLASWTYEPRAHERVHIEIAFIIFKPFWFF